MFNVDAQYVLTGGGSAHKVWEGLMPDEVVEIVACLLRDDPAPAAVLVSCREILSIAKEMLP